MKAVRLAAIAAIAVSVVTSALLLSHPVLAQSSGHGSHGGMAAPAGNVDAAAAAVVHSVDVAAAKINVTHDPIPSIGWPKMTMDLPVTKNVDISKLKAGDKITIVLKQGRDKQYRIIEVKAAQ